MFSEIDHSDLGPVLAFLPPLEFWKLAKFGESYCRKYKCQSFQICIIITKLSISAFHKSDQDFVVSNIHWIPDHLFDILQTMFQDTKRPLSKSGKVYSEAVHGKLKFKVLSKNICNKTWWHRFFSVCDELLKFNNFALFTVNSPLHRMSNSSMLHLQIALILYQIGLILYQTTDEASRVHFYTHLANFWAEMWKSSWSRGVLLKPGMTERRNAEMPELENPESSKIDQTYQINKPFRQNGARWVIRITHHE